MAWGSGCDDKWDGFGHIVKEEPMEFAVGLVFGNRSEESEELPSWKAQETGLDLNNRYIIPPTSEKTAWRLGGRSW
jgi:hypothetical protein